MRDDADFGTPRSDKAKGPEYGQVAILDQWLVVSIGEYRHLVGVLKGGHTRLPPEHWIVTSPIARHDAKSSVGVTASSGRLYRLLNPLQTTPPVEATDIVADALVKWGVSSDTPIRWHEPPERP